MSGGIKSIDSISNMAVFQDFEWKESFGNDNTSVTAFSAINIIYGRNYSGKTTLSRILRAMETGELSDKFENPSFSVTLVDGTPITQSTLTNHDKRIRVFNEDFVRDNLRFISNPDDSIEPFAILGGDNIRIESEIAKIEGELGSNEERKETGLYADRVKLDSAAATAAAKYDSAHDQLERQLGKKATDRSIGIKYKADRFGDQNYNIVKLKSDICTVLRADYQKLDDERADEYGKLIGESVLPNIGRFAELDLNASRLVERIENVVTKQISKSDKIVELVEDANLNRWAKGGQTLHKNLRQDCGFCGNPITIDRWDKLERHFDEESEDIERNIDELIHKLDSEKTTIETTLKIDKSVFYSRFHERLNELDESLNDIRTRYLKFLDALTAQLSERRNKIFSPLVFKTSPDVTSNLIAAWEQYSAIRRESNQFSQMLALEQRKAKEELRLKEVSDYLVHIEYQEQHMSVEQLKRERDEARLEKRHLDSTIVNKKETLVAKKRELNDEEQGAKKVNEYLNGFFGHPYLSLESSIDEVRIDGSRQIRFEVTRDGAKAYHLSEGECRLLAFCYFLAKLDDIDTKDSKPVIWIDDPVSSLDGNHIFFVFSLLDAEIVSRSRFEQLFVSTHNLDFLKYLKRLNGKYVDVDGSEKNYQKGYFVIFRQDKVSRIEKMPRYLKAYVTEFNYLFHQIYRCAEINGVDDSNYTTFYNFANNARKFFEIYLYYKYPDTGMTEKTLQRFFGEEKIPAVLTNRINNEYSHLCGVFERGSTPIEVPEMQASAQQIIERLKKDEDQYAALLNSVGLIEGEVEQGVATG